MANQFIFANNAATTLTSAVTSGSTVLQVASGTAFPAPSSGQQFAIYMTDAATGLVHEVMYVTANASNQFTVTRGQEGTAATSWAIGDIVQHVWTAGTVVPTANGGNGNTLGNGGRLLAIQRFTSSGTYTQTPNATTAVVFGVGGGGGGGGAGAGAGAVCCGSGGTSGTFGAILLSTSTISGNTVTIGTGGSGGNNANGNAGTSTTIGSVVAFPAGNGGLLAEAGTSTVAGLPAAPSATSTTSGTLLHSSCGPSSIGIANSGGTGTTISIGGTGGSTPYGHGGVYSGSGLSNGTAAAANSGAGGSGAGCTPSNAATGGDGGSGYVEIWEYS